MVLVDSSVWIALLRDWRDTSVSALKRLLDLKAAALSPVIYQEILQGAGSPAHFDRLQSYFSTQPMLVANHPVRGYEDAARIYAACRWKGVTPRSPVDCVVAQTAIEHKVALLAHDRDFDAIARCEPRLRLYRPAKARGA